MNRLGIIPETFYTVENTVNKIRLSCDKINFRKFMVLGWGLLGLTVQALGQDYGLRLVSPTSDSMEVTQSTVYLRGIMDPGSFLFLDEQEVKVYSTGVFAAPIMLSPGENKFILHYGSGKDTLTRTLTYNRIEPVRPKATEGFAIESIRILPGGEEVWMHAGERLVVEMKASPGMSATFFKDVRMAEMDSIQVGVAGIYRGEYLVKDTDEWSDQAITFAIYDEQTANTVSRQSDQKLTLLTDQPTLVGLTNKTRTPLSYGLGADRLGGAKMGFIDRNIRLEVTGKMQGMYRVRLSDQAQAFVSENDLDLLQGIQFRPHSLTGSWSVTSDGENDFISIGLSQRLPYVSIMEQNPARIVVDIYGAVSNSNWITQREGLVAIENVWYEQVSKDQFRAIIQLKEDEHWGHEISYRGNSLSIRVKPKPADLKLRNLTIAVDAGHGGSNRGAVGLTGVLEKDLNLSMAQKVQNLLIRKGAKVVMTRSDDSYTTNPQRLQLLKDEDPDLLISIHCNAGGNPMVGGASTYYRHQAFRPLTQYIYDEMLKLGLDDFGNVGGFNFTLNSPTEFPSVLVEVAFMSNPADEERLLDPKFHDEMAESIVRGLENFLKSK